VFQDFRDRWIGEGERQYIRKLLKKCQNDVSKASTVSGLDRSYIYKLKRRHAL
jgi:transcriptional regulator of acetoin/glycerol metabolism